ncbi:hypothetical protein VIGAN_01251200, partial [Vigna angularis var. angularis]
KARTVPRSSSPSSFDHLPFDLPFLLIIASKSSIESLFRLIPEIFFHLIPKLRPFYQSLSWSRVRVSIRFFKVTRSLYFLVYSPKLLVFVFTCLIFPPNSR